MVLQDVAWSFLHLQPPNSSLYPCWRMEEGRDTRRGSELNASSPKRVLFCISPASTSFLWFAGYEKAWLWFSVCNRAFLTWTINNFLFFGDWWGASVSTAVVLRIIQEGNRLNLTFFSTILVFLLWFQLAQGSVWRAGVRQGNRDGIRICHSLRAQVIPIPLNILRIITGYSFFTTIVWKKLQIHPSFGEILVAARFWPLKLF